MDGLPMAFEVDSLPAPGLFLPLGTEAVRAVHLVARVEAGPGGFGPRLREVVAAVDPGLVVTDVRSLDDSGWENTRRLAAVFGVLLTGAGVALLLALASLYAILSFTVARRTREIGVRVALGGRRREIGGAILARAARQVALGVLLGGLIVAVVLTNPALVDFEFELVHALVFAGYLLVMTAVCGLASVVPTRRALAVEPMEALRAEG